MMLQVTMIDIDWNQLWFGEQGWSFLVETVLRTFIMFVVVLAALTILGKRGVRQLSVFELVVIIGLGSAAGDPMFYKEVGILPAIVVFIIVITLYVTVTYFVGKSKRFEYLLEGKPVCLIRDGRFSIENFKKESLGQDEFFAELRMKSVSQLGQVEQAIIETSGELSIFLYPDDSVKPGLSIMPDTFKHQSEETGKAGFYACTFCGNTEELPAQAKAACSRCGKKYWVTASDARRIS